MEYLPRFDIVARARRSMKAGETVVTDHSSELDFLIRPAAPFDGAALPLHMAGGIALATDVRQGELLTAGCVEQPKGSALWELRREQEAHFGTA